MRVNIFPLLLILFAACVGGLIGGWHGALVGFTVALGVILFFTVLVSVM